MIDPPDKNSETEPHLYTRGKRGVRIWHKPITRLSTAMSAVFLPPKLLDMLSKSKVFGRRLK